MFRRVVRCFCSRPSMDISIALVGPKSPQNVGAAARAMANFGFSKLYISAFDGTDVPAVEVEGSRASFTKFAEGIEGAVTADLQNRITLRFPTPDGKLLSFPGRDMKETLESFFRLLPYQAQVLDTHGCEIHGSTPHAFAWLDKGRLLLHENGKATSLLLRDQSHVRYGGHLRSHEFVAITEESYWMATSPASRAVLDSHSVFSNITDLRGEFDFIIGTSGSPPQLDRTQKARAWGYPNAGDLVTPRDLLSELVRMSEGHQGSREHVNVLLVFGREMTGLHHDELAICDRLLMIPTLPWASASGSISESNRLIPALANAPSLNLSHAVAVVLYALNQQLGTIKPHSPRFDVGDKYMTSRERDILHTCLFEMRKLTARTPPQPDDAVMLSVRRALDRATLSRLEFQHLMGLIASANKLLLQPPAE